MPSLEITRSRPPKQLIKAVAISVAEQKQVCDSIIRITIRTCLSLALNHPSVRDLKLELQFRPRDYPPEVGPVQSRLPLSTSYPKNLMTPTPRSSANTSPSRPSRVFLRSIPSIPGTTTLHPHHGLKSRSSVRQGRDEVHLHDSTRHLESCRGDINERTTQQSRRESCS